MALPPSPPLPLEHDPILRGVPYVDGRKRLGPVALEARLGSGTFGAVYRGRHLLLEDKEVAVKCLILHEAPDDPESTYRIRLFRREARIGTDITHENLVRVFEIGEEHGIHYLVLELVDGQDLSDYVKKRGRLPERDAARCVLRVARGLAKAHQHPDVIIHRDIKPGNILVSRRGEVKLGDLGLAKAIEKMSTAAQRSGLGGAGTPAYMAPEQEREGASVTPAADVWALGVTLYFLLVGRVPGPGVRDAAWRERLRTKGFPDVRVARPDVSPELAQILADCTRFEREDRIPDAPALVQRLNAFLRQRVDGASAGVDGPAIRDGEAVPSAAVDASSQSGATRTSIPVAVERVRALVPPRARPWILVGLAAIVTVTIAMQVVARLGPGDVPGPGWERKDPTRGVGGWAREVVHVASGIEFVLVEPGEFEMGSPEDEKGREPTHEKQHHVRIPEPFYLARTEVTRLQYWQVLRLGNELRPTEDKASLPQISVSWTDAQQFCELIDCELPTEARWEYAARAGEKGAYTWGSNAADGLGQGNFFDITRKQDPDAPPGSGASFPFEDGYPWFAPVGRFAANRWGFHDLLGNAAEWCGDAYQRQYELLGEVDPFARMKSESHVVRGGSFSMGREWSRLAWRKELPTAIGNPEIGFRPMRRLP